MNNIDLQDPEFEEYSISRLKDILATGALLQRSRALYQLGRRVERNDPLLDFVLIEINDPMNRATRTVGFASISFLGVAGLLASKLKNKSAVVTEMISHWPEMEQANLQTFLE